MSWEHQSLLDRITIQMGCTYLSDLRYLSRDQQLRLAEKLKSLQARDHDLRDWNDALEYLAQAPPEATPQAARGRLLERLNLRDTLSQRADR